MGEQQRGGTKNYVIVTRDGQEALDILHGRRNGPPKPNLMLVDLNLPRASGHDVLNEIRADLNLQQIPVTVSAIQEFRLVLATLSPENVTSEA